MRNANNADQENNGQENQHANPADGLNPQEANAQEQPQAAAGAAIPAQQAQADANAAQDAGANREAANNNANEELANAPQLPELPNPRPVQNAVPPRGRQAPEADFFRPLAAPPRLQNLMQQPGIPPGAANHVQQNPDNRLRNAPRFPELPDPEPGQNPNNRVVNANLPQRRADAFLRPLPAPIRLRPRRQRPDIVPDVPHPQPNFDNLLQNALGMPELRDPQPRQNANNRINNANRAQRGAAAFVRAVAVPFRLQPRWQQRNINLNAQQNADNLLQNAPRLPELPDLPPRQNANNRINNANRPQRRAAEVPAFIQFNIPVQPQRAGAAANQDARASRQPVPNESAPEQAANLAPPAAAAADASQNERQEQQPQRNAQAAAAAFRPIGTPPERARRRRADSSPDSSNSRPGKKGPNRKPPGR
jgi:hypothetical protein